MSMEQAFNFSYVHPQLRSDLAIDTQIQNQNYDFIFHKPNYYIYPTFPIFPFLTFSPISFSKNHGG